jgi:hypothetical protein
MSPAHIHETITLLRRVLDRIEAQSVDLQDVQWDRGRRPATVNDAGTRQRGGKADPTGETAADQPRLKVREALAATHRDLDEAARLLLLLDGRMGLALKKWQGEA